MMKNAGIVRWLLSVVMVFLLAACSDSGGGVSTATPPPQVGLLTVTPADAQLNVSWNAVAGATGYEVYYSTTNDSTTATRFTGDSNTADTTCTITGLTNGTAYYVWARAMNSAGGSSLTAAAAPATPRPPLATPVLATVTPGDGQVTLTWSAVAGANSYEVYYGTSTSSAGATKFTGDSDTSDTTATVTGLTNGTSYYFWVKAIGNGNSSALSAVSAATSPSPPVDNTAFFNHPQGIATDGTYLYVADTGNNTIRKIALATGVTTTLAGTEGQSGSVDGIGAAARFNYPVGLVLLNGMLYLADTNNNQIRKINPATAEVTTVAGKSVGGIGHIDGGPATAFFGNPIGIATDGTYLYVTDSATNTIRKVSTAGITTTIAASASLSKPLGITCDSTNLYLIDGDSYRILKIDLATEAVTTLAGTGGMGSDDNANGLLASFGQAFGLTHDGTNLYLTDTTNSTVRRVNMATGATSTLAGRVGVRGLTDGIGTAATFDGLKGITIHGGNLYVTEYFNSTIRKIVIGTGFTTTVAGTPPIYN